MKLFQYAVIYHPKKDSKKDESELIVPITTMLAENDKAVALRAARAIPKDYEKELDQCEIAVRPF